MNKLAVRKDSSNSSMPPVTGKKQWTWVWQSAIITFIAVSASRGSVLINALFPNGFPFATLCSDRWKPQLKTNAKNHQLCLAHLLRELEYLIQAEKTSWANQFKELLLQAIKLKQTQKAYNKDHPQTFHIEQQLDTLLGQSMCEQNTPKTISLKNSMAKYRQFILPFLYDPLITYDNNASERDIRNVKVKLKVSGQFKTGQEHYCILRSIIDTTIKRSTEVTRVVFLTRFDLPRHRRGPSGRNVHAFHAILYMRSISLYQKKRSHAFA